MLTNDAVLLVDWLNLSITLRKKRKEFGSTLVRELMKLASQICEKHGDARLAAVEFVGENITPSVERAIENTLLAELHKTRTEKEQADLVLAVLIMDHLHRQVGCPKLFILVTGDQDFVPLIERIVKEGAEVALIVGAAEHLSPEYRSIAAQRNVQLFPMLDHIHVDDLPLITEERSGGSVLGLLRLCMSGGILGGDQSRNIQLLSQWRLLVGRSDAEVELDSMITKFTRYDQRRVAVPGTRPNGNKHLSRRRTYLDFAEPGVAQAIGDADWILR